MACEVIIELGDMDFWQDKDKKYRYKMIDVYREQIQSLSKIIPNFKVANATVHFDETSPHMHVVGVPIIDNCKRGMKKQVGKSQLFTKTLLSETQDKMRNSCIKSYNKFYDVELQLKEKQKGRNQDINVKDMGNYKNFKKQMEQNNKKLEKANTKTKIIDNESDDINIILDNLKPSKLNKNNMLISNENIEKIKKYTSNVKDTTKTIRSVNDLNLAIKDFEHSAFEIDEHNRFLEYQLELKNNEIEKLKTELSRKDKIIDKLKSERDKLKEDFNKFKGFWRSLMKHFQIRIGFDKDEHYKYVSEDLYKNGIFDDNDKEIADNVRRKVKTIDEINNSKDIKKKNNDIRF